jgi:hypothetical protein
VTLKLPALYPGAIWDPINPWATTGYNQDIDNPKVVWHTTQGSSYPRSTYVQGGGVPHYTIDRDGNVFQHYHNTHYSRALLNLSGGVETNKDGAIQIEIVGFAGKPVTRAQRAAIRELSEFFTKSGIPGRWMNDAPTIEKYRQVGLDKMSPLGWDHGSGHCGHSDVPENDHWDPALTRLTRRAIEAPWKAADRKREIRERIKELRDRIKVLRTKL